MMRIILGWLKILIMRDLARSRMKYRTEGNYLVFLQYREYRSIAPADITRGSIRQGDGMDQK